MPRPPLVYRLLRAFVRLLVGVFFREIVVEGEAENVPRDRGGLLVAWHPNGIVDPALILASAPVQVVFGARHGLLRWPVLGTLMRGLGTVPIYRAQDAGKAGAADPDARRAANDKSLGALADAVQGGRFAALFPEGVSHDAPFLSEVKTGAARLFLRAADGAQPAPVIVPVGLHYDRKDLFRSDVVVAFHPPIDASGLGPLADAPDETSAAPTDAASPAHVLTDRIEGALVEAVRPTEDWALHRLMHRAYALMRAEDDVRLGIRSEPLSARARARGFHQIWTGYQHRRRSHPDEIAALRRDLADYDRLLRASGMTDADLDRPPLLNPLLGVIFAVQLVLLAVLLPPVLVLGFVVNAPPYLALKPLARRFAGAEKDTATIKILGGLVLFPLAWLVAGVVAGVTAARLHDLFPAVPDAPLAAGAGRDPAERAGRHSGDALERADPRGPARRPRALAPDAAPQRAGPAPGPAHRPPRPVPSAQRGAGAPGLRRLAPLRPARRRRQWGNRPPGPGIPAAWPPTSRSAVRSPSAPAARSWCCSRSAGSPSSTC